MILLDKVCKSFNGKPVLRDVSLSVKPGELWRIEGPSGAGKTTLLRLLMGLVEADAGTVKGIKGLRFDPVFQEDRLVEHWSALENVRLVGGQTGEALLDALLPKDALAQPVRTLSGGMRRRVALARALAVEPQILLLDEPFGALDAQVRKELRRWLRQLHEELKFTSVFVTHDQEEATEVADRVVVMSQGNIEQADAPDQVWREPATRFVLEFMGEVNRLQGTIRGGQFHVGAHRWPLGYTPAYQGPVDLFLRPWEVDISRRTSLDSPLPVQVLEASPKGHYTQLVVQPLGWYNEPLTVVMHGDDAPQRGERLFVGLQHARLYNGDERIETRDEELALAQSA